MQSHISYKEIVKGDNVDIRDQSAHPTPTAIYKAFKSDAITAGETASLAKHRRK